MSTIKCISMNVQLPLQFKMQYDVNEGEGYASIGCEESGTMLMTFNTTKSEVMKKIYRTIRKAQEYKETKECKTEDLALKKEKLLVNLKEEIIRKNSKSRKNKKTKKNVKRIKELRGSIDLINKKMDINDKQAKDNELKVAMELIAMFDDEESKDHKVGMKDEDQRDLNHNGGWERYWREYWANQ